MRTRVEVRVQPQCYRLHNEPALLRTSASLCCSISTLTNTGIFYIKIHHHLLMMICCLFFCSCFIYLFIFFQSTSKTRVNKYPSVKYFTLLCCRLFHFRETLHRENNRGEKKVQRHRKCQRSC